MMRVAYITNIPAPYRVEYFNEIAASCELTVIYERGSSTERDSAWVNRQERRFSEVFCNSRPFQADKSISFDLIREIKKHHFDVLVACGYCSPSVVFLIYYCQLHRIPYFIETDGNFPHREKPIIRALKRSLISKATAIFSTSDLSLSSYRSLGYKGRLIKYPLSPLHEAEILQARPDECQKLELRRQLQISEKFAVLSVGRFTYRDGYGKGYDVLMRAAAILRELDIGWYIVGGAPTEEFALIREREKLNQVHFVDFQTKEDLARYYLAADVFVLMTVSDVWGLVINEAMAYGLPVITTEKCMAGLEMIQDEENGFILPVGDEIQLVKKLCYLRSNPKVISEMSHRNLQKSHWWTIERMASVHMDAFKDYTGKTV